MPDDDIGEDSIATEVVDAPDTTDTTVDTGADDASQELSDTTNDLSQVDTGATQTPVSQNAPAPATQTVNWEQRYKDTQSWATQQAQRAKELERQWDGMDPKGVREQLAELERIKQQQTASPFTRQHPEYQKNQERIKRVADFKRIAAGEDEDTVRRLANKYGITAEDVRFHDQGEDYRRQESERMLSDPRGYMTEVMEPIIQQKLQELDQFITGRANAQQWLNDPKNNEIVSKYAPQITQLLDDGRPLQDKVQFLGETFSRLEALEKQLGSQIEQVSTSQAQSAALNQRAQGTTRRGPSQSNAVTDGSAYVRDVLKIKSNSPDYLQTLLTVNDNIRNGRAPNENL